MPLITDYSTVAELKAFLRITDSADDAELAVALTAASRAIDQATNRAFGQTDPAVARYYTWEEGRRPNGPPWEGRHRLDVDDISTTTGLVVKVDEDDDGVYETTLTVNTDFQLWPWNAAAESRPWEQIVLRPNVTFPTHLRAVEVTAKFGWATVPTEVEQAAQIQAARFFSRRNSPYGVAGSPDLGNELRLLAKVDADVEVLLRRVRKEWFVA